MIAIKSSFSMLLCIQVINVRINARYNFHWMHYTLYLEQETKWTELTMDIDKGIETALNSDSYLGDSNQL
jgi:hypothetical protein